MAGLLLYGGLHEKLSEKILFSADIIQKYTDAGLIISDIDTVSAALNEIGYYRLRGYRFHLFDKAASKFQNGTSFDTILAIYRFDEALRKIIFAMTCEIEVTLRARYCSAMLLNGDPLIYLDPSLYNDKGAFWKNLSSLSSEIERSSDVFIQHNFDHYDGQIPLWAAVEVMSFGNLSKTIKNLKTGAGSPFHIMAAQYSYTNSKGNAIAPGSEMLSSWIYSTVTLRNICAHNSRIYNRALHTKPQIISSDRRSPSPKFYGLYEALLAMKYLRPSDESWNSFMTQVRDLINQYSAVIDLQRMNFPGDWEDHLFI